MSEINKKLRACFDGKIVRMDHQRLGRVLRRHGQVAGHVVGASAPAGEDIISVGRRHERDGRPF